MWEYWDSYNFLVEEKNGTIALYNSLRFHKSNILFPYNLQIPFIVFKTILLLITKHLKQHKYP